MINDNMKLMSYSLKEISQWQKEIGGMESKIFLPSLQRGFVWKPNQIEALWDSIFRGYPIGAILMSIDKDENRNLLDGQQRCTSIALGHFNPIEDNYEKFFSLKTYKPSIWVDLAPRQSVIGQKFVFRCLTQSHPWVYQLRESSDTLSMSDRRNALDFFKENQNFERYTDLLPKSISPWDSQYPIPLSLILGTNANSFSEFKIILFEKIKDFKLKTKYSQNQFVNYYDVRDEELELIYLGCQNYKNLQIPEIVVNANVLKNDDEKLNNDSEDPTLFVRLNSAGTRISGEELNYSIYKAHFPKVKDLIENIGASYIAPCKVISLFSRLAAYEQSDFLKYHREFTIQNFRKRITEDSEFNSILQKYIENDASILIDNAVIILQNNDENLPKILIKQIIVANIDLFFVLLAHIRKVGFDNLNENARKEIAASYVYILWFNKDNKKIANELFTALSVDNQNFSWKTATKKLVNDDFLIPLVSPSLLQKHLETIVIQKKIPHDYLGTIKENGLLSDEIKSILSNNMDDDFALENWNQLINRIFWNKSMLLYAQKKYINSKFKEFNQFESIDDTNRPWDWDHIYPNSWVYYNQGINQLVKSWVNCIGNFRALSYDDNRSENNNFSPMERFENDDKKEESFINESDLVFWNKIDQNFRRIKKDGDEEKVTIFLNAVIQRMMNIYKKWYVNYYYGD